MYIVVLTVDTVKPTNMSHMAKKFQGLVFYLTTVNLSWTKIFVNFVFYSKFTKKNQQISILYGSTWPKSRKSQKSKPRNRFLDEFMKFLCYTVLYM